MIRPYYISYAPRRWPWWETFFWPLARPLWRRWRMGKLQPKPKQFPAHTEVEAVVARALARSVTGDAA